MHGNKTLDGLIKEKYGTLSAAQKKAADYIFQNPQKAAFNTAVQIGMEAGTSDSSVIRLSYTLGFRSFSEMQDMIRKQFMDSVNPEPPENGPEEDSYTEAMLPYVNIIKEENRNLTRLLKKLNVEDISRAAEALIKADQVLIMGYFYALTPAYEFYLNLSMMRPNVFFYRTTETEYLKLYNLTEQSVVLAVSYPTDITDILKFIGEAKRQGATVISVTNSELSQVSSQSDIPFTVDISIDNESGYILPSSAMAVLYFIIMNIKERDRENVMPRLENVRANVANYYSGKGSDL